MLDSSDVYKTAGYCLDVVNFKGKEVGLNTFKIFAFFSFVCLCDTVVGRKQISEEPVNGSR